MLTNIVGFDLRVKNPEDAWPLERRTKYLLNPNGPPPCSVDRSAWPKVSGLPDSPTPPRDLWIDLNSLEAAAAPFLGVLVAVGLDDGGGVFQPAHPQHPDADWQLLGFDVVDSGLISGLCNLGMSGHEDVSGLRARWARRLNQYGLFGAKEDARQFCTVADAWARSHAPFWVASMWSLPRSARAATGDPHPSENGKRVVVS